jgi:hypothetical protein
MLEDFARTRPGQPIPLSAPHSIKESSNILKVTGVLGGIISTVGPSYDEIVAIPDATWSWKVILSKCQADLEKLRKKNEAFVRVLLELDNPDLEKTHSIDPQFSWRWSEEMREILKEKDSMSWSEWKLIPVFRFVRTGIRRGKSWWLLTAISFCHTRWNDWVDALHCSRRRPAFRTRM